MKRLLLAVAVIVLCTGASCPNPPPQPPPAHTLVFPVRGADGTFLETAEGALQPDLSEPFVCPNDAGKLICLLTAQSGGANMIITAPGYKTQNFRLVVPQTDTTWADIQMGLVVPPIQRLRVQGKSMVRADGTPFNWQGVTAFQLVDDIADGREAKAVAFMDWAAANDVTILRTLVMARNLFALSPSEGRASLSRVLELAQQRGLYVEVVALADTKYYQFDHRGHVSQIGHICTLFENCVVELTNEPNHASQDPLVKDPFYLQSLRRLVPAHIMVSLGAAHGPSDESQAYTGGDYVTVHISRAGGDDGWRWVRHAREIQAMRDHHHGKFVVNDEPDRKAPYADQHLALGLLMRMYGIGDTVHLGGLRFDQVPVGDDLVAFNARRQAWSLVDGDWSDGRYTAAHLSDSPVKVNDKILRAYSSLRADTGYTLLIKADAGGVITWRNGWKPTLLVMSGKTLFYRVDR